MAMITNVVERHYPPQGSGWCDMEARSTSSAGCGRGREPRSGGSRSHIAFSVQSRATSVARTHRSLQPTNSLIVPILSIRHTSLRPMHGILKWCDLSYRRLVVLNKVIRCVNSAGTSGRVKRQWQVHWLRVLQVHVRQSGPVLVSQKITWCDNYPYYSGSGIVLWKCAASASEQTAAGAAGAAPCHHVELHRPGMHPAPPPLLCPSTPHSSLAKCPGFR